MALDGFFSILFNPVISSCFPQFSLTPLHLASWYGHESVVKLLLKYGANVNTKDRVSNKGWGKGSSCFFYYYSHVNLSKMTNEIDLAILTAYITSAARNVTLNL